MRVPLPQNLSLKTSVHTLEDAIITLSGPALAISGIIAGVDLVTGGHILQQVSWLAVAWAITLLLTLDFQVLALGARSHQIYLSEKKSAKRKIGEIALAVIIAASISFVSIQMQSIIARVNSVTGLSIEQAAIQLGINTIYLVWERSALVLVLIFMSGWFREVKAQAEPTVPTVSPTVPTVPVAVPNLEEIITRMDAMYQQRMVTTIETIVERTVERVTIPMQAVSKTTIEAMGTVEQEPGTDPEPQEEPGTDERLRSVYRELSAENKLTVTGLAQLAHVRKTTASKWLAEQNGKESNQ